MKTGILLLLAALLLSAAPAQADDRVVVFGDSIANGGGTANPDHYAWPTRMGAEHTGVPGGCLVTACGGRPGVTLYRKAVLVRKPDAVVIAYGVNDLVHSGPRQIVGGMKKLKRANDARGIETYIATLTPIGQRIWGLNDYRGAVNDLIRKRFAAWHVIDFDAALVGPGGDLPARFDSGDNLHLNARAYKKMARIAARVIR